MATTDNSDLDVFRSNGGVATSPFEIQITRDALQRRLDSGEITRDDIDILKRSYRWMTVSSALGAASGIPVYFAFRRRTPPVGFGVRVAAATAMAMTGSFLGFTMGGAAAAMEVNNKMPDASRKLKVFQQIVIDSKRAIEQHRNNPGAAIGMGIGGGSGVDDPAWDPERTERAVERERESSLAPVASSSSSSSSSTGPSPSKPTLPQPQAWDRLRANASTGAARAPARTVDQTPIQAGAVVDDSRIREQREFDALLDKERQGGDDADKWR